MYNISKHTILPLVYKVIIDNNLAYLLKDPLTKSLILLNPPKNPKSYIEHFWNIVKDTQCSIGYIFSNTHHEIYLKDYYFNDKPILQKNIKIYSPQNLKQLQPQNIGQLSICYVNANGYQPDYNLIAVTHMTPTSTKIPILMPDKLIGVCSIDMNIQVRGEDYLKSLTKMNFFPNETYIFPTKTVSKEDILFAEAFIPNNQFIQEKQSLFDKHSNLKDVLIPTTILQQKTLNPFLNAKKCTGLNKDPILAFNTLKKIRTEWKSK